MRMILNVKILKWFYRQAIIKSWISSSKMFVFCIFRPSNMNRILNFNFLILFGHHRMILNVKILKLFFFQAIIKCENDLECAGFTFHGSFLELDRLQHDIFFFRSNSNSNSISNSKSKSSNFSASFGFDGLLTILYCRFLLIWCCNNFISNKIE